MFTRSIYSVNKSEEMQKADVPVIHSVCVSAEPEAAASMIGAHGCPLELHRFNKLGASVQNQEPMDSACTPRSSSSFPMSACFTLVTLRQHRQAHRGQAGKEDRDSSCARGGSGWTRGGMTERVIRNWNGLPGMW